ncbi:MAG: type transport system ATP-binding protein [Solirubrobacterales bacterium]|jgi:ABC-2 type transport system ATP-binding protein|nr:type transport system ATP-binding protein [Solirubrobacterales bacterium]
MAETRAAGASEVPIEAKGLTKSYRGRPAVAGIDLTVLPGEVYGFLGPNGAGKTTTMRMLLGLVRPDAGSVRLFGRDVRSDPLAARAGVAGIIEEPRLYSYLSGRMNLRLLAGYDRSGVGADEIEEVLETVELRERGGDRVSDYSQGMRQRLGIAACLVRRPRLLLLDEPANGLDPAGIRYLRGLLRRLSGEGMTVLLSSHLLAEVQELCEQAAIISSGRIVYEGGLDELRARAGLRYRLSTDEQARAAALCAGVPGVSEVEIVGDHVEFAVSAEEDLLGLTRALSDSNLVIRALIPEQLTLERVFFELTETPAAPQPVTA